MAIHIELERNIYVIRLIFSLITEDRSVKSVISAEFCLLGFFCFSKECYKKVNLEAKKERQDSVNCVGGRMTYSWPVLNILI